MNVEQECRANKKGISTVWRCTSGGRYYSLDIEDERYPIVYKGRVDKRMVYRFVLAAAQAYSYRDYINMDPDAHYNEFTRAFRAMAYHNSTLNER